jgi:ATP synthase subunit 6
MLNSFSPLEQFEIVPFLNLNFFSSLGFFDFSITNQTFILFIFVFVGSFFYLSILNPKTYTLYIIPTKTSQKFVEFCYEKILSYFSTILKSNINYYFPLIFTLFFYVLSLNMIGLIPYSFTITSHISVTLGLSASLFIGTNLICIRKHKFDFFNLFLPKGTLFAVGFLLVPIELLSFVFKPFSLAIRLFANMVAGHALLKIVAGFAWKLMNTNGILFFVHLVPILVLFPLIGLEIVFALIQAFVFTTLFAIYVKSSIDLH